MDEQESLRMGSEGHAHGLNDVTDFDFGGSVLPLLPNGMEGDVGGGGDAHSVPRAESSSDAGSLWSPFLMSAHQEREPNEHLLAVGAQANGGVASSSSSSAVGLHADGRHSQTPLAFGHPEELELGGPNDAQQEATNNGGR